MNSTNLKQKFPRIYQDFFGKCQKVISAPHSFFWTGDFSSFYGGLTISSKLPLRFYVGLEEIEPSKLEIDPIIPAYLPYQHKFSDIRLDNYLTLKLNKLLNKELKGYRIHFLTEIVLGASLGGLGALSACLAKLTINDNKEAFNLAWKFIKELQRGRTSGATTFTALAESPYPIVSYSRGSKFWGKPLDQIFSLDSSPVWPIDFGLIFSGNLVQGAAVIASAEEIKKLSKKRELQIAKILNYKPDSFWFAYLSMLNQVSYQNLTAFSALFKKGSNNQALAFFFNTINQYHNLLHFLEISSPNIDRIYSAVHKTANILDNGVGSGCKLTGVGKGGEVLFAVPYGEYREKILKLTSSNSLDYASWVDGFESEGTKMEQDLSAKVYSSFIPSKSFILKIYNRGEIKTRILLSENLEKEKKKVDLFLDTVSDKVYLKGRGINSSALPSQKATIEIMKNLLDSQDKILKNDELPKTYAENRFDLQSKITTPLSRLVPLKFEISGGMYENYILKLSSFDTTIGILEKI